MSAVHLPLLAFFSAVAAVGGLGMLIYDVFFRYRGQVDQRLSEEFGRGSVTASEQTKLFKDLSRLARETEALTEGRREILQRAIDQSGLNVTLEQIITACLVLASLSSAITGLVTGLWWAAIAAFTLALPVPGLFVATRRERRLNELRRQLPDAFEMMSRSISAGQTVSRAFQTVAEDFEPPISEEFAWCFEQQNLGLPQEVALRDLARRAGVTELQMLVVALLVQRQSGGSPVELLDNLAHVVRQRIELAGKVKTLTAEGRMQAVVLLLMPPLLLAIIATLNPEYVAALWERPLLLMGMLGSELLGVMWIRRIISFDF